MIFSDFAKMDFLSALKALFKQLNVPINYVADEPTTAKEILKDTYKDNNTFRMINDVFFVGMVDDAAFEGNASIAVNKIKSDYDGILIFGITLQERPNKLLPTRSQLAEISRAFNREFYYTPVIVIFQYENYLAFANTERLKYKQEWREGEKAGKVSLLRDIDMENPHSGHVRILQELKIPTSGAKKVDSFTTLYAYWQEVFSVNILNKKFYQELSNWYFWAIKHVSFPNIPTPEDASKKNAKLEDLLQEHKATNVIRMLTRLLFVWFIKEKKLIPEELFELQILQKDILNDISPDKKTEQSDEQMEESVYYKAILQNLFFATLNCPIESESLDKRKRGFRGEGFGVHRGIDYLMRYKRYFKNPDEFLEKLNSVVPFLNGGLFECLDDKINQIYIDGFSDNMSNKEKLVVPDYLFFGLENEADLSDVVGLNEIKYKQAHVKGLINILKSYKFTITENTPIEEDIALDPELLGKVFENLLASYNPETKTTARKQTGSFYTPREIVNYMVDESLIAYLKTKISIASNVSKASSFRNIQSRDALDTFTSSFREEQSKDALATLENVPNASSFRGEQSKDALETLKEPFLNPFDEIEIKQGMLPHWNQNEVFYFLTFRLADSIPKEKMEALKIDREDWLKNHRGKEEYSKEEWKEYNRLFNERVENWMNAGYGSCLLKKPENAALVANAFKHFAGQRYTLDEWVVMPNHVHVLVKPFGEHKLCDILHSWKSFTANEINKREGRTGQLWMHESYDHIVRSEQALQAIRNYIRQNPVKAGIHVPEASNVQKASNVPEASSFRDEQSRDALETLASNVSNASSFREEQSKDALNTLDTLDILLHQLISFDNTNPFKDDEKTTKEIITALSSCTILDPACGSGAFPMGILQKMVHILQKLDPDNKIWKEVQREKAEKQTMEAFDKMEDKQAREVRLLEINEAFDQSMNDPDYARKLFLIENCIFGVDIQPIATQISKLRFFISLVVEQKVNPDKSNFGIRPLPNLETKFVAANTLIGIEKPKAQMTLFDYNEDLQNLEAELKKVRSKLFSARSKETKLKYRQKDEELRNAIAVELVKSGWESENAEKLAKWDPYDQNTSSPFFDPEWMFDIKDGFDIVIGNPPYIGEKGHKEIFRLLSKSNFGERFYQRKMDIFYFFFHYSLDVLRDDGVFSFITTNYYPTADGARNLRLDLKNRSSFIKLVNFNETIIFESAKGQHNLITIGLKSFKDKSKTEIIYCKGKELISLKNVVEILNYTSDKAIYQVLNNKELFDGENAFIRFEKGNVVDFLNMMQQNSFLLKDYFNVNQGILSGVDKISNKHIVEGLTEQSNKGNGVFVLSNDEVVEMRLQENEKSLLKKFYKNSDVHRYWANTRNEYYLLYLTRDLNINNYPNIKQHVLKYKKVIKNRSTERGEMQAALKLGKWWVVFAAREKSIFDGEKIISPQRSHKNTFAYNDTEWYSSADVYYITKKNNSPISLKYLLGVLNSSLYFQWLYKKGKKKGEMLELYASPLENIPIKTVSENLHNTVYLIVSLILEKSDILEISVFQDVIDALIFELYFPEHMKERGIDVLQFVEWDINEVSAKHPALRNQKLEAFETLPDTEKEQIIQELHAKWSHPDNEVVKRMSMFKERSPEILKPILES